MKDCKGTGAVGEALKSLSGAGSTKCGVMVSSSPVPPSLKSSWLLILITEYSGGFLFLWLLMKTNMARISLPAQHCCDLLPHIPAQAALALPSKGILNLPPSAQIFLHWSPPAEDHHSLFLQQREGGTSPGGAGSVPSLLLGCWNSVLSLPVLEKFPCRISTALGSG